RAKAEDRRLTVGERLSDQTLRDAAVREVALLLRLLAEIDAGAADHDNQHEGDCAEDQKRSSTPLFLLFEQLCELRITRRTLHAGRSIYAYMSWQIPLAITAGVFLLLVLWQNRPAFVALRP